MTITAILQTYKRPSVLKEQVEALQNQSIPPTEIWICHNGNEISQDFDFPISENIHLINSSKNFKFHLRFAIGLLAQTEYVCLFDDDTIPGSRWFENCLKHIKQQDGLYGTIGVKCLEGSYIKRSRVGWAVPNLKSEEVDLVGHSWFLKSENLKYLWMEDPISYENGEDIQLSYSLQKYANLKTYVPPHPMDDKTLWGSIKGAENQDPQIASFKAGGEKQWYLLRDAIVKECIKRGWVTCQKRS